MSLPLTAVGGYVRADSPAEAAGLSAVLDEYARRAGLVVCHVHRESAGATGATLPAFAVCLEMVRKATARGILLPSWPHLAPNRSLGASLLHAAHRDNAPLYVVDDTTIPDWALSAAAATHEVQAHLQAAGSGRS